MLYGNKSTYTFKPNELFKRCFKHVLSIILASLCVFSVAKGAEGSDDYDGYSFSVLNKTQYDIQFSLTLHPSFPGDVNIVEAYSRHGYRLGSLNNDDFASIKISEFKAIGSTKAVKTNQSEYNLLYGENTDFIVSEGQDAIYIYVI